MELQACFAIATMSKMSRIINTEELVRNAPFELSKADKEVLTTTEEVFYPAYLGGYSKYNWLEDFLTCGMRLECQ